MRQHGISATELRRDFWFAVSGLVLTVVVSPIRAWLLSQDWQWAKYPLAAGFVENTSYGIEHLGVVLVVAVLIRVAVESASEQQFLSVVNEQVKNQISDSIKDVSTASLEPLKDSINDVKGQIEKSIQQISAESLAPLRESIKGIDEVLGYTIRRPELIDEESRKELHDKVLSPKFLRTEYKLTLTLEPVSGTSAEVADLLKVRAHTFYKVKNLTKDTVVYPVKAWVDTMIQPPDISESDKARFISLSCDSESMQYKKYRPIIPINDLMAEQKIKEVDGGLWLEYDIDPGIPGESTYYVDVVATQLNRKQDLFVWVMGGLTKKLDVVVEFAGGYGPDDFKVDARELHHMGHDVFRNSRKDGDGISWSINQVLLPYQGVQVWWVPKPPVPAMPVKNAG